MAAVDAGECQAQFDAFLSGEVIESPAPELINVLSPKLIESLQSTWVSRKYEASIGSFVNVQGRHETLPLYPKNIPACEEAGDYFASPLGVGRAMIQFRYGRFQRYPIWRQGQQGGVNKPHIDGLTTIETGRLLPVFTSSMVVGAPTIAWLGKVRRSDGGFGAEFVDGHRIQLRSGGLYLFNPMSVHWEPTLSLLPRARYFWRHFHINGKKDAGP